MSGTEKIKDDLHGVESIKWDFNKKSVPLAHGTIPESRKFKSFEFASLITLGTDESRIIINVFQ